MPLNIFATENVRLEDETVERLRAYLDVGEPAYLARLSAGDLPQYIGLIGASTAWIVLVGAAGIFLKSYLSKLGEQAAEGTVGLFQKLRKRRGTEPIADVANILVDLRKGLGGNGSIVVGISLSDEYTGPVLRITESDPLDIAIKLSYFVLHAMSLEDAMKAEMAAGRAPLGNASVFLGPNGGLTVTWWDKAMTGKFTIKLALDERAICPDVG